MQAARQLPVDSKDGGGMITLVPTDAFTIDTSSVQDIERERMVVTFQNGRKLHFAAQRTKQEWLLLDRNMVGDAHGLVDVLARRFYDERVKRSPGRRLVDWLKSLIDPHFHPSFSGWKYQDVARELRVELHAGNEIVPSSLCVGRLLQITYGTEYSTPAHQTVPWGVVKSIEDFAVQPTAPSYMNYA